MTGSNLPGACQVDGSASAGANPRPLTVRRCSNFGPLMSSKRYNRMRYRFFRMFRKLGMVSDSSRGSIIRFNNSVKSLINHQQNIFEGLNIRYFGPVDWAIDISLSLRMISRLLGVLATLFSPSKASPPEMEASPITATTCLCGCSCGGSDRGAALCV